MNSAQAKKIPLQDYLSKLGFDPVKQERHYLVYFSPFRDEKTPSFKLNLKNNTYRDYGSGESGKIIEFNITLFSDTVSQALERIDNVCNYQKGVSLPKILPANQKNLFSKNETEEKKYTINKIQELKNIALIQYINSRCINIRIAKKYLSEIYYTINEKTYFTLGFQNNSKGFETRNKFLKGNLLKKDITTVTIKKNAPVFIFEGFIDFLSYLTYFDLMSLKKIGSVIILNSNSLKEKAIEEITKINPTKLIFVLDNDKSGNDTVKYFQKDLNLENQNQNIIYSKYKDFNDFLIAKQTENEE